MNKLINTENGGHPFTSNDLRWMQDSYLGGLFAIAKAFAVGTNSNFIITGCDYEIDGLDMIVDAGYIMLNGEILQVETQTIALTNIDDVVMFSKMTTYDSTGYKRYANGVYRNTYMKNRAILTRSNSGTTVPTTSLEIRGNRLSNKVRAMLIEDLENLQRLLEGQIDDIEDMVNDNDWGVKNITLSDITSNDNSKLISASGTIRYWTSGKMAVLDINVSVETSAPLTLIGIALPSGITCKTDIVNSGTIIRTKNGTDESVIPLYVNESNLNYLRPFSQYNTNATWGFKGQIILNIA